MVIYNYVSIALGFHCNLSAIGITFNDTSDVLGFFSTFLEIDLRKRYKKIRFERKISFKVLKRE